MSFNIQTESDNNDNNNNAPNGKLANDTNVLRSQFETASNAIQNLPKEGQFQPSNETLLKFYGYFKQATVGACKKNRPSIFNVVERAKWDAWNSVSNLTQSDAMSSYINEINKIIETMPDDKHIQNLKSKLDLVKNPKNISEKDKKISSEQKDINSSLKHFKEDNEAIDFKQNKSDFFELKLPTNKKSWNNWADEKNMSDWAGEKKPSFNGLDFHKIKENGFSDNIEKKSNDQRSFINQETNFSEKMPPGYCSEEDEDFCDTSDFIQEENGGITNGKIPSEKNIEKLFRPKPTTVDKSENNDKDFLPVINKFGGETGKNQASLNNYIIPDRPGHNSSFRQSRPGSSLSTGYRSGNGAGGYPPNENFNLATLSQDTNRQILLILLRLQQDTNNVITRLSYLEATVLSLQNNLQMNRIENSIHLNNKGNVSAFRDFNSRSSIDSNSFSLLFNFLRNVDWKTVVIALMWPLIIRLIFFILRKIKLVIKFKRMGKK